MKKPVFGAFWEIYFNTLVCEEVQNARIGVLHFKPKKLSDTQGIDCMRLGKLQQTLPVARFLDQAWPSTLSLANSIFRCLQVNWMGFASTVRQMVFPTDFFLPLTPTKPPAAHDPMLSWLVCILNVPILTGFPFRLLPPEFPSHITNSKPKSSGA